MERTSRLGRGDTAGQVGVYGELARGTASSDGKSSQRTREPPREGKTPSTVQAERLKVKQTATGYWVVERGAVQLAGATTQRGAEAERDLLNRLRARSVRRVTRRRGQPRVVGSRPLRGRR